VISSPAGETARLHYRNPNDVRCRSRARGRKGWFRSIIKLSLPAWPDAQFANSIPRRAVPPPTNQPSPHPPSLPPSLPKGILAVLIAQLCRAIDIKRVSGSGRSNRILVNEERRGGCAKKRGLVHRGTRMKFPANHTASRRIAGIPLMAGASPASVPDTG